MGGAEGGRGPGGGSLRVRSGRGGGADSGSEGSDLGEGAEPALRLTSGLPGEGRICEGQTWGGGADPALRGRFRRGVDSDLRVISGGGQFQL